MKFMKLNLLILKAMMIGQEEAGVHLSLVNLSTSLSICSGNNKAAVESYFFDYIFLHPLFSFTCHLDIVCSTDQLFSHATRFWVLRFLRTQFFPLSLGMCETWSMANL